MAKEHLLDFHGGFHICFDWPFSATLPVAMPLCGEAQQSGTHFLCVFCTRCTSTRRQWGIILTYPHFYMGYAMLMWELHAINRKTYHMGMVYTAKSNFSWCFYVFQAILQFFSSICFGETSHFAITAQCLMG